MQVIEISVTIHNNNHTFVVLLSHHKGLVFATVDNVNQVTEFSIKRARVHVKVILYK